MNVVVFDDVIVAAEQDGRVRSVEKLAMVDSAAHAGQADGRPIGRCAAGKVADPAVGDAMIAGRKRAPIPAGERDATLTGLFDGAPPDEMTDATVRHDGAVAEIAQRAMTASPRVN
jgi:hypothetical protein